MPVWARRNGAENGHGWLSPPPEKRCLRGRVVEKKKDELKSYMEQAGALVKAYVPSNPEQMKAAFQAGNASLGQAGPGALQLQFKNYVKPGDSFLLTFNTATKALTQISVNTYMDGPSDAVPGGPHYVAQTVLNAPTKNIQVQTTSPNYRRMI